MPVQVFAQVAGVVFLSVGLAGFVPVLLQAPPVDAPDLMVTSAYGYLFGFFPVNAVHNGLHAAIGVWGLLAYGRFGTAIYFARRLAILYGVLAVLGLIPGFRSLFGLVPIWGWDVWLHTGTAAFAAYVGYGERTTRQWVDTHAP